MYCLPELRGSYKIAAMKYSESKAKECFSWVEHNGLYPQKCGAPIKVFCEAMGIGDDAYYEWMKKYAEFNEGIKKAQAVFAEKAETKVVDSLFRKAVGYEYETQRAEAAPRKVVTFDKATGRKVKEELGSLTTVKVVKEKIVVAPDTAAAIFLLTNIAPEKWKNYQRAEIDASLKIKHPRDLTPEEAAALHKHLEENY